MRKYFLKLFLMVFCLALFLTACGQTAAPEEFSGSDIPDPSSSEPSKKEDTSPIAYPEWASELIWQQAYSDFGDQRGFHLDGPEGTNQVSMYYPTYTAVKYGGDNCIFCVGVPSTECWMLDYLRIEYGPVSKTDFIMDPGNSLDDYVRAYLSREQIQTLIKLDIDVALTVPERPSGYSEKIADSLAFLLETSHQDTYGVMYSTKQYHIYPKGEALWDLDLEHPNSIEATKEEIFSLAEDPDVCLIHISYGNWTVNRTSLKKGQPCKTETIDTVELETRELWEKDNYYTQRLYKLFGVPEEIRSEYEQQSLDNWSQEWTNAENET